MTLLLLTLALAGAAAPAGAVVQPPGRAGMVHASESTVVRSHVAAAVSSVSSPPTPQTGGPKPWALLAGAVAAIALSVRRRHSY